MRFFRKKRKLIRASNAIDGATTAACWGKKRSKRYPGVAGKGGVSTNHSIPEWMFDRELTDMKEGIANA